MGILDVAPNARKAAERFEDVGNDGKNLER
jgi:hypothetical protein